MNMSFKNGARLLTAGIITAATVGCSSIDTKFRPAVDPIALGFATLPGHVDPARDFKQVVLKGEEKAPGKYVLQTPHMAFPVEDPSAQTILTKETTLLKVPENYRAAFGNAERVWVVEIHASQGDNNSLTYIFTDVNDAWGRLHTKGKLKTATLPVKN